MDATIKQKLLNIDRETDSADGRMRFLMTSDALDRDGEVVDPDGMLADSFMRNPVFLYGHDSYAPPMGRIVSLSRTGASAVCAPSQMVKNPPAGSAWVTLPATAAHRPMLFRPEPPLTPG